MMAYGTDGTPEEMQWIRRQYSDNVVAPAEAPQADLLLGPFSEHRVIVEGRVMPLLTGLREGDKVWLIVDHRFCCGPFGEDEARQAAILAGQAMAVTAGYPHLGAVSKDKPFAPVCSRIDAPSSGQCGGR